MSLKLRIRWATQLNQCLSVPPPVIPVQAAFPEIINSIDDLRYRKEQLFHP